MQNNSIGFEKIKPRKVNIKGKKVEKEKAIKLERKHQRNGKKLGRSFV